MRRIGMILLLLAASAVFVSGQPAAGAAACRPILKDAVLSASAVPGGAPDQVTVALTCAAPSAVTIRLTGFRGVTVPSLVRVPRNKASASTDIMTAVTKVTRHGEIEATLGLRHRRAALTVTRTPRTCRSPALTGFSVPAIVRVGDKPTATIRLSCAAAAPVRISLASTSSYLPVPVTISVGRYYRSVTILLAPKADPAGQYSSTLSARFRGRSRRSTITVDPGLAEVALPVCSEPNCVDPEVLFTGVLPAGGLTVRLASDSSAVTVPASYTFPAGSLGGGVAGVTVRTVSKDTTVTISATLGGRTLRATTVLLPPFNSHDKVTLTAEAGTGPVYGQEYTLEYVVTLSNPAPAAGLTATFSSPSSAVELQSTSTFITGGFADGYVDINTAGITSAVHTRIDVTVDGVSASLPVIIEPGLASITNVPATITGGSSFTATVSLAGPVDTATTVALQSSAGIVTVPGLVVIPAGHSSASFLVTTAPVTASSGVFISAWLGSTTIYSSTVTLTP